MFSVFLTNYIAPFSPRSGQKRVFGLPLQVRASKIRGVQCHGLVLRPLSPVVGSRPVWAPPSSWPFPPPLTLTTATPNAFHPSGGEAQLHSGTHHLAVVSSFGGSASRAGNRRSEMKWKQSRLLAEVAFSLLPFRTSHINIPRWHTAWKNLSTCTPDPCPNCSKEPGWT